MARRLPPPPAVLGMTNIGRPGGGGQDKDVLGPSRVVVRKRPPLGPPGWARNKGNSFIGPPREDVLGPSRVVVRKRPPFMTLSWAPPRGMPMCSLPWHFTFLK